MDIYANDNVSTLTAEMDMASWKLLNSGSFSTTNSKQCWFFCKKLDILILWTDIYIMLEKLECYAHNVPTGHCTYSVTGFSWMLFCTFVDQTFPKAVQLNKKDICRLSCAGQELQKSILKQLY